MTIYHHIDRLRERVAAKAGKPGVTALRQRLQDAVTASLARENRQ